MLSQSCPASRFVYGYTMMQSLIIDLPAQVFILSNTAIEVFMVINPWLEQTFSWSPLPAKNCGKFNSFTPIDILRKTINRSHEEIPVEQLTSSYLGNVF